MYGYIGMDILRFMQEYVFACGRMFVFILVAVFTATFCADIISSDGNLACFSPIYLLPPQERRRRFHDLPICMD